MFKITFFSNCKKKNKILDVDTYEDNLNFNEKSKLSIPGETEDSSLLENSKEPEISLEYEMTWLTEQRVKNMCYKWNITRHQALELINIVDSQQTKN